MAGGGEAKCFSPNHLQSCQYHTSAAIPSTQAMVISSGMAILIVGHREDKVNLMMI